MNNKWNKIKIVLFIIILLALLFELIKDTQNGKGDFVGYLRVGNLVLSRANIYSEKLNT